MNRNPWLRGIAVLAISVLILWFCHQGLLIIFSNSTGNLSEFGNVLLGYLVNLWAAINFYWITTGRLWPTESVNDTPSAPSTPSNQSYRGFGLSSAAAVGLLTILWVAIWFYVNLLQNAFLASLSNPATIGVALEENAAMRIATTFAGLLALGAMLPLMSGSAFFCGWLSKRRPSFLQMLLPAVFVVLLAGVMNNWQQIAATGLPPAYDVVRMVVRSPLGALTIPDMIILWLLSILFGLLTSGVLALLAWIWSALGHWLKLTASARAA